MNDILDKLNEIISKSESIKEIMTDDIMFDSWIESSLENCISELEQALYYLDNNKELKSTNTGDSADDDNTDDDSSHYHNYDNF